MLGPREEPTLAKQQNHNDLLYSRALFWLRCSGRIAVIGFSDDAQKAFDEIAYVELPVVGTILQRGQETCAVESYKAATGIETPVSGRVIAVNEELKDNPALINEDCYGRGWLFRIELTDEGELSDLLRPAEYAQFVKSRG